MKPDQKTEREKQIRAVVRELKTLRKRVVNPPSVLLAEPIQRGWVRRHVLTKEAESRPDRETLAAILRDIGRKVYSRHPLFLQKKCRRSRKLVEIKQPLHEILVDRWSSRRHQRPDEWRRYFHLEYKPYYGGLQWFYVFTNTRLFELKIEPHWLTHVKIAVPFTQGTSFYDAWHGRELDPQLTGKSAMLSFPIEANGFGAILAVPGTLSDPLRNLLTRMAELSRKPLASFSAVWKPLPQHLVPITATSIAHSLPPDMVLIPGGKFHFQVHGVEIEGWGPVPAANEPGVDVQYPWESLSLLVHDHQLTMRPFYIDKYPVTNAQYKAFLSATHYYPADDHHFLKDWTNGHYPAGWARKPVTWVSLEDARAYANWAGKRLPHEWVWQYAAQGTDGRAYPWGATLDPAAIPASTSGHNLLPPSDVDAHPKGASAFGVMDLTNNVWQGTDEYEDDHTRAAILRGGSSYRPAGSFWYFPRNTALDQHAKYLLMCPGKDRAGTVGFRCVVDAAQ